MLIAEIGNNHFGSFEKAKELIRVARESGATLVKSQAFLARDIKSGSMPYDFYRHCEFTYNQYEELIYFARDMGVEFFYSIFSRLYEPLMFHQRYYKVAGSQTREGGAHLDKKDSPFVFISVPEFARMPWLNRAQVLYVSEYLVKDPKLQLIGHYKDFFRRPVGYSDHTVGITQSIKAIHEHDVTVLEKHFHLGEKISWKGQVYRDSLHSIGPRDLEAIAKEMKGEKCAV